jgi:hypothetical protein
MTETEWRKIMSSARDSEIDLTKFNLKSHTLEGVTEVFLIAQGQGQHEDLSTEEKQIAKEMGFENVSFEPGSGIYKNKYDAIAVAKKLIENNPLRKLAVISAIS